MSQLSVPQQRGPAQVHLSFRPPGHSDGRQTQGPSSFFSYSDKYLIDTGSRRHRRCRGHAIHPARRRSSSTRTMTGSREGKVRSPPRERLIADTAYGTGQCWGLARSIARSPRTSLVFATSPAATMALGPGLTSRGTPRNNQYICPEGQTLRQFRRNYSDPNLRADRQGASAKYLAP